MQDQFHKGSQAANVTQPKQMHEPNGSQTTVLLLRFLFVYLPLLLLVPSKPAVLGAEATMTATDVTGF